MGVLMKKKNITKITLLLLLFLLVNFNMNWIEFNEPSRDGSNFFQENEGIHNLKTSATDLCWFRTFKNESSHEGRAVALDNSNNIIAGGDSLVKYNESGVIMWTKDFSGFNEPYIKDVATDSQDNIIALARSNQKTVIMKFNKTGTLEWNKTWGEGNSDEPESVDIDLTKDTIYITGETGTYAENGTSDCVIIKYNSTGDLQWNKTWGKDLADYGKGIAVDTHNENIYITGTTETTTDYDDIFLLKYDLNGNKIWSRRWAGDVDYDRAESITLDQVGNIIITGDTYISGLYKNLVVIKYDPSGTHLWNTTWGTTEGTGYSTGYDITADSENNLFITGAQNIHFPYGLILMKYNRTGDLQWIEDYGEGGGLACEGKGVKMDSNGNVYVVGMQEVDTGDNQMLLLKYAVDANCDLPTLDLEKGDSFIYEITYWNQTLASSIGITDIEELLGAGAQVGAKKCYTMESILLRTDLTSDYDYDYNYSYEDCNGWEIIFNGWYWTTNENGFSQQPDGQNTLIVYEKALDVEDNSDYLSDFEFGIVPKPSEAYLSGIRWGENTVQEESSVTYESQTDHYFIFQYNDRGVRNMWNYSYVDETVFSIGLVKTYAVDIEDSGTDNNGQDKDDNDNDLDSIGINPWETTLCLFLSSSIIVIYISKKYKFRHH